MGAAVALGVAGVVGGIFSASSSASATRAAAAAQERIANRQLAIAEAFTEFHKEVYWPCQRRAAMDACMQVDNPYEPKYEQIRERMGNSVKIAFAQKLRDALRCVPRYCSGLTNKMIKDFAIAEAKSLGSAVNFGYRYEEARAEAFNDRAWSRRESTIAIGSGLPGQALGYYQTAAGLYGQLGSQAARSFSGALSTVGYSLGRIGGALANQPNNTQTTINQGNTTTNTPINFSVPQQSPNGDFFAPAVTAADSGGSQFGGGDGFGGVGQNQGGL